MEAKVKKIIKALKNNADISDLDVFNPKDSKFKFYYNATGYYKEKYFDLSMREKKYKYIEISECVTENIKELNIYLDSLTDLKFTITY